MLHSLIPDAQRRARGLLFSNKLNPRPISSVLTPMNLFATRLRLALLVTAILCYSPWSDLDSSVFCQESDDILGMVQEFEKAITGTIRDKRKAASKVLKNYKQYQKLLEESGEKVSTVTRSALDDQLGRMTRETWSEIGRRYPDKVTHVIPVGTYGTRNRAGSKYKPGFSDKDFIPQGNDPTGATKLFNEAFERKWGVRPENLDVNVLDPTDIDGWKSRTTAIGNTEKYNTKGGNNWLNQKLRADNPQVWQLDRTGNLTDSNYDAWLKNKHGGLPPPAELKGDDALGLFSDNTRFRQNWKAKWQSGGTSAAELAEHQAKYDLRNLEAFEAAGEKLTAEERRLMTVAEMFRDPKKKHRALDACRAITGKTNADDAMLAYLKNMDDLNQRMGSLIVENHVSQMAKQLADGKPTQELANELVSSMANLPARYADEARDVAIRTLGYAEWTEIDKVSRSLKNELHRVRASAEYFDDMARYYFGQSYDKLNDAEKAVLHGSNDVVEGFGQRASRVLGTSTGAAFAIWAIHDSYTKGLAAGESGYAQGFGRAAIELLQLGYPPLVAAELAGRLTAGVTELCATNYTERQIDELLTRYKQDPSQGIDGLLASYGVDRFRAGALRQLAIEIRQMHPGLNLTEALIDKRIKEHLQRRLRNEKLQEEFNRFTHRAEAWISRNDIPLLVGGSWISSIRDNAELKRTNPKKYNELIGRLLQQYYETRARLVAEQRPFAEREVWHELFKIYRGHPPKSRRDVGPEVATRNRNKARVIHTSRARIHQPEKLRKDSSPQSGKLTIGQVLSSPSGSWKEKIDEFDPPKVVSVIDVPHGGSILAKMIATPPAPRKWSLGNSNTGVIVTFRRKVGNDLGAPITVLSAAGEPEKSRYQQEGSWEGAGQLTVTVNSARGSGPLTGGQFNQSFSGTITVTKVSSQSPLLAGTVLMEGDEITSDGSGYSVLDLEPARIWAGPNTKLKLLTDQPGVRRTFDLATGKIRYINRSNTAPLESRFNLRFEQPVSESKINRQSFVIIPSGTDFELEHQGQTGSLKVYDGEVSLTDQDGHTINLEAGQQVQLPNLEIVEIDLKKVSEPEIDGLSIMGIPADDHSPQAFGRFQSTFTADRPTGSWLWIDPQQDASFDATGPSKIRITVPDKNELWGFNNQAPRLLHKVTGDFDVQALLKVECEGTDNTMWKWLVYSPGSHIGLHAKQMRPESSGKDYQVLCDAWSQQQGLRVNAVYGRKRLQDFAPLGNDPIHIRATRRGNYFKTYWSRDGKRWSLSSRVQLLLPETIWVGGAMQRMAYDGRRDARAIFSINDLRLTTAELGSLPIPQWDFVQSEGTVDVHGGDLRLTVPRGSSGLVMAISGAPRKSDQDVQAAFQMSGFVAEPNTSNAVQLIAFNEDESNYVYVNRIHEDRSPNRFATDLKYADAWYRGYQFQPATETAGGLRLMRRQGKWLGLVSSGRSWKRLDKGFTVGFEDPVYLAIRLDKTGKAAEDRELSASVKLDGWDKEKKASATQPLKQKKSAVLTAPANTPTNLNVLNALGLGILPATREVVSALKLEGAVAVIQLKKQAIVSRLDLRQGDMITHLNSTAVRSPKALEQRLLNACKAGKRAVYLTIVRPETESRLTITVPLPIYGQRYRHPEGLYAFTIPDGWFLISGLRSRVLDPGFDSLFSPDATQVVIISRYGIPTSNPLKELQKYMQDKQLEARRFRDVQAESFNKISVPAFRVSYRIPQQSLAISRVAFMIRKQRYVVNVVKSNADDTRLSDEIARLFESFSTAEIGMPPGAPAKPVKSPPK